MVDDVLAVKSLLLVLMFVMVQLMIVVSGDGADADYRQMLRY